MLSRSILAYYDPIRQSRRHAATSFYLIRNAFAVRERLGDPRDLPYFCGSELVNDFETPLTRI